MSVWGGGKKKRDRDREKKIETETHTEREISPSVRTSKTKTYEEYLVHKDVEIESHRGKESTLTTQLLYGRVGI